MRKKHKRALPPLTPLRPSPCVFSQLTVKNVMTAFVNETLIPAVSTSEQNPIPILSPLLMIQNTTNAWRKKVDAPSEVFIPMPYSIRTVKVRAPKISKAT